ncbi:UNVERIFIED_CONTAM: hypothetical protein HDU68_000270 [Siphonaria sp. JEL0065]|nr:hypothetical protein HDU68_000270 [Siphonaria sp. JEL0065]
MQSQPPLPVTQQDQREANGPFYTGLFLTFFAGPLIGSIPLCCADPQNQKYRGYYMRGMAFALMGEAVLIAILAIIIVQACNSSNDYYTEYYNGYNITYSVNCNGLYSRIFPIAVIWGIVAISLFRRSKFLIANALSHGGGPGALVQVVTYGGAPPMMQQQQHYMQTPIGPQYPQYAQPAVPPPNFQYAQPGAPSPAANGTYAEPSNPPPPSGLPAYSPMDHIKQPILYAEPSNPPPTPVNAGPSSSQPVPENQPAPLTESLSLESLAVHLDLPKILTVTEGITGVLEMSYNEMNQKYGITPEEFLKIKAYRKSLGR